MTALHHLDVKAITTVAGNCDVDQATLNVSKVLQLAKRDVPIFEGCNKPLIDDLMRPTVHGKDGLGEAEIAKRVKGSTHCI